MPETPDPYPDVEDDIAEIQSRKPGVARVRDLEGRYCVLGAESREPYADWLTPIEQHYVCHRHGTPAIDAGTWTVSVSGSGSSLTLSMGEIRESYPTVAVAHTMECAGNGRDYFDPPTGSVQWAHGAVGTAFWTGTPVSAVLHDVGIEVPDDRWLTAVGGDEPTGNDVFARSIPLAKALEDCILAYGVNGGPLPPEHGHPVRLLVPGWYGVNSVKWLDELRLTDGMVRGPEWADRDGEDYTRWQQRAYRIHPPGVEPTEHASVDTADTWEQWISGQVDHPYTFDVNVKSLIGRPDDGSVLAPREDGVLEVVGVAWAGDDRVETIEISTDGGETWTDGDFVGPDYTPAWRLFRFVWSPDPGTYTLVSRATDEHGRTQPARISPPVDDWDDVGPDEFPYNEGGYAENAYVHHAANVEVEDS